MPLQTIVLFIKVVSLAYEANALGAHFANDVVVVAVIQLCAGAVCVCVCVCAGVYLYLHCLCKTCGYHDSVIVIGNDKTKAKLLSLKKKVNERASATMTGTFDIHPNRTAQFSGRQ